HAQEDGDTKDPDEFARFAVGAIEQPAQHVQVDHNEEHGGAGGVHVAYEPAPRDLAHDVFNGVERKVGIWLVVHDQENAGHDLNDEYQQCKRPKEVPKVEVLGCVIFRHVFLEQIG